MACQSTATATLQATSFISSNIVSTKLSTSFRVVPGTPVVITTCVPTIVRNSTTCAPKLVTSPGGPGSTSAILYTAVVTVPVVRTVTGPAQTLFAPCITTPTKTVTDTTTKPTTNILTTTYTPAPIPTPAPDPSTATSTTTVDGGTTTAIEVVPQPQPDPTTPTPTPTPSSSTPQPVFRSTSTSTGPNGVVTTMVFDVTPPDQVSSSTPNTGAIVGGVVGGVVVLVILIGIIWRIIYKQRSGRWDDTWEENEAHRAGQAEIKPARPAVHDNSSSPNPYVYGAVGRETPSRSDQASATHSYSRTNSTATGYAGHTRTNSETPLMFSPSPPHSPTNLQQPQLHGSGPPVWASAPAQQGYFPQGYPPIHSDPNFAPTGTSTYHVPPTQTGANSGVAYPPGAAPPAIGGRSSTYSEYHKPPLEPSFRGSTRSPSQHYQSRRSSTSASFMDASIDYKVDHKADFHPLPLPPGATSVHTPSIRDRKDRLYEKGGLDVANSRPMSPSELPRQTSPAPSKAPSHAPIFEEGPPGYRR